jgi:DNA polymerase I-like protein with 3'-5' exonuclease and polymerase domains
MRTNYVVIDLETSIKNRGEEAIGKFKANPFHPDNKIVMAGNTMGDTKYIKIGEFVSPPREDILVVGHNIGFDLLYLLRGELWREWIKKGKIWDTMLVAYLISGQQDKFASLDYCSIKHGGTLKDDAIKGYWDADIDTEDIPKEELEEYLKHDVLNTEIVFLKQLEIAESMGLLPLIYTQMEARLATIEMEWNGMHVDQKELNAGASLLQVEIDARITPVRLRMSDSFPIAVDINPMSAKQLGIYLFGGEHKYSAKEHMLDDLGDFVNYKSGARKGQLRYKKVDRTVNIKGKIFPASDYTTKGSAGAWGTGEQVLKDIIRDTKVDINDKAFCQEILDIRQLQKDFKTYYVGFSKLRWPTDGMIHANFIHCKTDTGRLSCRNPNLQQLTH